MKKVLINILIIFCFCWIGILNCSATNYEINNTDVTPVLLENEQNDKTCSALGNFKADLQGIFNAFKIVAPVLTLVLSSFEYMSSVTSKDGDGIKKANKRLMSRIVLIAILFFLPILLNIILNILYPGSSTCIS